MKLKNITIVTYDWPPRNSIAVHRPYTWAKYWLESNIDVTIITSKKKFFDKPLNYFPKKLPNIKVITLDYNDYASKSYYITKYLPRFFLRKIKKLIYNFFKIEINLRKNWASAANLYFSKNKIKTDVLISTFEPQESHIIGSELKKIYGNKIFWVTDFRDFDFNKFYKVGSEHISLKKFISTADLVTSVSNHITHQISKITKKKVITIHNGYDLEDNKVKQIISNGKNLSKKITKFVHTGTLYPDRVPHLLLKAIGSLYKSGDIKKKSVFVDFYGERVHDLKKNKNEYNYFTRFFGGVTHAKSIKIQQSASILLLIINSGPNAKGILTGKLFEYLVSGRPILCIGGSNNYEIGQILKNSGTGILIENNSNQKEKIKKLLFDTIKGEGLHSIYKPNIDYILNFSRKKKAMLLLEEIKKIWKLKNRNHYSI